MHDIRILIAPLVSSNSSLNDFFYTGMIVIDTIQDSLLKDSFSHVVMSKVEDVPAKTRRNNAWVCPRKRLIKKCLVEVGFYDQ